MPLFRARRPELPFVLYSKPDCGLCATAETELRRAVGPHGARVVNIVGDRELEDAYIFRIPVLTYRDVVLAEGIITAADVGGALGAARALDRRGASGS